MASNVAMKKGDELAGKVALVTGAARNIGRAIARSLAAGGAAVMVNAKTSRDEAQETVEMIEKAGGRAAMHMADITDAKAVAGLVDATAKRFGRLDLLVNNAALRVETPFADIKLEEWRNVLAIVLDGPFLCSQAALPHMIRAGGGAIVNIGGTTGHRGVEGRLHVVTAKGGLAALTKGLALDLAPHHITVNCVVPGLINTTRGTSSAGQLPENRRSAVPPVGRRGEPEEVATVVRMLCGPESRFVTGQAIHVNGGTYMP
jgi:3-oxoacyl-[acyl-carrier protein] reductase